jgi:two-component system chemotaxis sensor kinase CheA
MAKDPYRYFRIEASEHLEGLTAGVLELEKHGDRDVVNRLLRHAHTLKGAARVVRQPEVSELSHAIEEILAPIRDGQQSATRENINQLLQLIDAIAGHMTSLAAPSEAPEASAPKVAQTAPGQQSNSTGTLDSIRVDIADLDPLLHGLWEAGINLGALRNHAQAIDHLVGLNGSMTAELSKPPSTLAEGGLRSETRVIAMATDMRSSLQSLRQNLRTIANKTGRELRQLQDRAAQLRLLPASSVFPSLERVARDAADSLGKQIEFQTLGGESRLDAHVLRALQDALLHVVRNAVSHGIENPDERAAKGKPVVGRVQIAVERRGSRLAFVCHDDGRGVDAEQIGHIAVRRGLLSAANRASLSSDQTLRLLLRGGISTAGSVTEHAGRGVGMDVVRETVERLEGSVEMRSTPSNGTSVEIIVPVSLESMSVLELEVEGHRTSIPFNAVRRVVLASDGDIAHSPDGDSILFDGVAIPLLSLNQLLFPETPYAATAGPARVVVIEVGHARAAISVSRAIGQATIILKPLPAVIGRVSPVLGACLDVAGNPQTVLDPLSLVEAAHRAPGARPAVETATKVCVLVVDDSLTTRMLEQSILETAGYEVDLAVSAEEALVKAKQRAYAIFVVDVEMPGMSGFEFVATVKADPDLRRTPAVLVTSRSAPEDRARGESVGASAYVIKGEFEEASFLRTIRRLIG